MAPGAGRMAGWLARVMGAGQPASAAAQLPPPQSDAPLFAIGDVHGRADLLVRLLDRAPEGAQILCLGDYVDRGEESAAVLRLLSARPDILCLKGNHEAMMLSFLDAPRQAGPAWLRSGGLQTLASFGIGGLTELSRGEALDTAAERLQAAMGAELLAWLQDLPLMHRSGNVAFVHAAVDPAMPLNIQAEQTLLWGHPDFVTTPRSDGIWVAHGHVIVDAPVMEQGHIAVDTGAYATGRLTALVLDPAAPPRFETT